MRNPNAPRQGDDLQYRVNLSFEEAIFGAEKEVSYNRESSCHTCPPPRSLGAPFPRRRNVFPV